MTDKYTKAALDALEWVETAELLVPEKLAPRFKKNCQTIRSALTLAAAQGEVIKGAGPGAAPLIRRTVDEDGKPVVILAEWWYEEISKMIGDDPDSNIQPAPTGQDMSEEIVGHKTMADGTHQPLYKHEADALWEACEREKKKREIDMPTEETALHKMWSAHYRLKELGWRDAIYCPKDGSTFLVIEAGSAGIHEAHYEGEWPNGSWWVHADGDLWPSRPTLFKLRE